MVDKKIPCIVFIGWNECEFWHELWTSVEEKTSKEGGIMQVNIWLISVDWWIQLATGKLSVIQGREYLSEEEHRGGSGKRFQWSSLSVGMWWELRITEDLGDHIGKTSVSVRGSKVRNISFGIF